MTTVGQLTLIRREAERLGLAGRGRPAFYAGLLGLASLDSVRDLPRATADELIELLQSIPVSAVQDDGSPAAA